MEHPLFKYVFFNVCVPCCAKYIINEELPAQPNLSSAFLSVLAKTPCPRFTNPGSACCMTCMVFEPHVEGLVCLAHTFEYFVARFFASVSLFPEVLG